MDELKAKVRAIEAFEHNSVSEREAEIARLNEILDKRLGAFEAWAQKQGYTGAHSSPTKPPSEGRKLKPRRNLARKKLRFFLFCYGY
jgi:hypothetical protein